MMMLLLKDYERFWLSFSFLYIPLSLSGREELYRSFNSSAASHDNSVTMSMADQDEATAAVVEGLKRLYRTKLKPLEQAYMFGWFHSPPLTDSEFESKPQVLMCGQYSTGKTSVSVVVQTLLGDGQHEHILFDFPVRGLVTLV